VSGRGPIGLGLRLPARPRVEGVAAWLRAVRIAAEAEDARGIALVVVSPIGLAERARLAVALADGGIRVGRRFALPCWPRIATAIRVDRPDPPLPRLQTAALFEEAWDAVAPGGVGEAWSISASDHALVARAKRAIRDPMRSIEIDFGVPGMAPRLLTPFHVADAGVTEPEARRILAAVRLLAGSASGGTRGEIAA
jgi:hypothetical protein